MRLRRRYGRSRYVTRPEFIIEHYRDGVWRDFGAPMHTSLESAQTVRKHLIQAAAGRKTDRITFSNTRVRHLLPGDVIQ